MRTVEARNKILSDVVSLAKMLSFFRNIKQAIKDKEDILKRIRKVLDKSEEELDKDTYWEWNEGYLAGIECVLLNLGD